LVVHVAGAVQRPGLVTVLAGARVADVIRAAGGPLPDADIDALNLAAFVTDAGRVYVPREGEAVEVPAVVGTPDANGVPLRIDLNVATAAELDRLPGIGPSLAAAVIAYRNTNGPFRSVDALLKVPGIGPAKLEQFRALVRV
jgi:competence protein ComEA